MKIWIVNPFDPLPGEVLKPGRYVFLARVLSRRGHKVTWWTSNFSHGTKSFRAPSRGKPNLEIIQLPTPKYKKNVSLGRIWNHYLYGRRFKLKALKWGEIPDIIISSCPPLYSAKVSLKLAKRWRVKCIIDIQDLWPEVFEIFLPPVVGKLILYPLKKFADSIYSSADGLMAVGKTFLKRGLSVSKGEKMSLVLYLGTDLRLFDGLKSKDIPGTQKRGGEFWVTYIGTIGKSYDLQTVVECAGFLKDSHPEIKFFILGEGPELKKLKEMAKRKKLTNCIFTGLLPPEDMVRLLQSSDVGLNAIPRKGQQYFPNKVFDYMACGLPIINSVEGELKDLIESEALGRHYIAEDATSLKEAILELYHASDKRKIMGENARRIVEERFDRNKEYPKIIPFLEALVGGKD